MVSVKFLGVSMKTYPNKEQVGGWEAQRMYKTQPTQVQRRERLCTRFCTEAARNW
jgi:hypothetical protein